MNPESYQRASALFQEAVELEPDARRRYLDRECGTDAELRAAVESLLRHDRPDASGAFGDKALRKGRELLDAIVADSAPTDELGAGPDGLPLNAPSEIGPYRVLRLLGEGGMGSVYLCQQDEPVKRQVAVKLIKLGMDSERIVRHFSKEREALERMEHPGIARMLDAGVSADGRPFFAMEVVSGTDILTACDERRLPVRERLQIFIRVARAIHHAHQRGILHRDIKPSNVQVSEVDGQLLPKIIDFGLAQALEPDTESQASLAGRVVGTPAYMSPEQADPNVVDIDSRADVYSLGVLLYELITGQLPHDGRMGHLSAGAIGALAPKDAVAPSSRYSASGASETQLAARRSTGTKGLRKLLKGDLDWITLMALDPDRERRYASASELASDVEAYLDHRPVQAGPPTAAYKIAKFYKRHRVAALSGTTIVALLAVGLFVASHLTLRAQAAEERALALLEDTRGQNDVFNHMLVSADPRYGGIDARFIDVLERGIDYTLEKYSDQPRVAGVTLMSIGSTLSTLGDHDRAEEVLLRAYEYRQATDGVSADELSFAANSLGMLYKRRGDLQTAKRYYKESLEHVRDVPDADDSTMRSVAATNFNLGRMLLSMGEIEEAEPYMLRAVELQQEYSANDEQVLTFGSGGLGELYERKLDLESAETYYGKSLAHARRAFPEDHPYLATALVQHGFILQRLGRMEAARGPLEEALAIARNAFPEGSVTLKPYLDRLTLHYIASGELERATELVAESESLARDPLSHGHTLKLRGTLHMAREEYALAEAAFREASALFLKQVPEDSPWVVELNGLAEDARAAQAR